MDRSASKAKPAPPGLSIRNGPVNGEPMDLDLPNGSAKRKSRASLGKKTNYKDESDSDDAVPLVRSKNRRQLLWYESGSLLTVLPGEAPKEVQAQAGFG